MSVQEFQLFGFGIQLGQFQADTHNVGTSFELAHEAGVFNLSDHVFPPSKLRL
jgi:hypothetical protein